VACKLNQTCNSTFCFILSQAYLLLECRDEAGVSAPSVANGRNASEDEAPPPARKSAFASMTLEDDGDTETTKTKGPSKAAPAEEEEEEEDDFGGLMSTIKRNDKKKDNKGKKGKKQQSDDIWDELGEDVSGNAAKGEVQMDVDAGDGSTEVVTSAAE
jgi:hypothetical protein